MVGTITPVVYGTAEKSKWSFTWIHLIWIYVIFHIIGSGITGAILGWSGLVLRDSHIFHFSKLTLILGIVMGIGGLHDLKFLPFSLPSSHWQVPHRWKTLPPYMMAASFGFGIGLTIVTRIPFGSLYPVLLASFGTSSIKHGAGLMLVYGTTRALAVAIVASSLTTSSENHAKLLILGRSTNLVRLVDGYLLVFASSLLMGLVLTIEVADPVPF